MKELLLVRHGKSSWDLDVSDINRPLKERGIFDAQRVAAAYKPKLPLIDAVYSSPANRALHTCVMVVRGMELALSKIVISPSLYDFSGGEVMDFVRDLNPSLNTVMLFGHNYAFTNIANQWGSEAIDNLPTAGLVHLKLNSDRWEEVSGGTTLAILRPKLLR